MSMKIGDIAKRSGFSEKTLRYYEEEGILLPASRTPRGYRLYEESALRILDFVRRSKRFGFTLAEIREVLESYRAGGGACRAVQRLIDQKLNDLTQRIAELQQLRGDLKGLKRIAQTPKKIKGSWVCPILGQANEQEPIKRRSALNRG